MKRAFYEWGAIITSSVAITCFVYWMASLATTFVDFELFLPIGRWESMQVLASNGTVTINDHRGSLEAIEEVLKYPVVNPPLTSNAHWTLPGFTYRSINWGGQLTWSLSLSMWIPTFLFTLAAAFFIRSYIQVRRQALQVSAHSRVTARREMLA